MEAVPKVPMLPFNLKQTQQKSSFSRLKQYIAEHYQEDPDTFSKEIHELETLRAAAYNPSIDETGCNVIKRYYCQLHSLQNRFPIENDRKLVNFVWRDIYSSSTIQSSDIHHDMAVVLYNYGAIHTQVAATLRRSSEEEMKLACTLFQRAAWAFETVREKYHKNIAATGDMLPEILIFMQNICFAQAQEIILEKSLIGHQKSGIVAKVASQIVEYYNSALAALLSGGEEGMISEIVGSKQFKEWRQYIQFKVQYNSCILLLHQGFHAEEQQKMGERVTLYQAAFDRLQDARKEAKHLNNMPQVNETLTFVMDVVEAKRKTAKSENEFIYHDEVPALTSIATVPGAVCVKPLPFNIADAANEDIFHRLVPIKTHERSSLYSEEKTNFLRRIRQKIETKDNELDEFMESLNIDLLSPDSKDAKLPQSIIDRCAAMNARPQVIGDLIRNMSSLAEICVDVESVLQSIQELLSKEEMAMGSRSSCHFAELKDEFLKYQEAHNRAGDSNDTLRKAMEMHVNNLRILAKPLADVHAAIPTCSVECDPKLLRDTQMLLNKVNEMRLQRAQLYGQLSENVQNDDITAQLVAWGEEDVDKLFKSELAKHDQLVNIIEQNLIAQEKILKTFTDAYAKCAHYIKSVSDTKHKRDQFISSLIASYDVHDKLLSKSMKGLEFYKELQSNIHKLCERVQIAHDVHGEERIVPTNKKTLTQSMNRKVNVAASTPNTEYPSLTKPIERGGNENYRSTAIRPTPIGQPNIGIDASHSSFASSTAPYNYNYPSTASAPMPSNYSQPVLPYSYSTGQATFTPSQPSYTQYAQPPQASQVYSNPSFGYMQSPQPNASSMPYTNYTPSYPSQQVPQNATQPSYYNHPNPMQKTATPNQYYGNDVNRPNNQYGAGYLATGYGAATNIPTNPANVYNYATAPPQVKTETPKSTRFDLMSDLDNIPIQAPTLQPIKSIGKPLASQEAGATKKPEENEKAPFDSVEKALAEMSLSQQK